MNKKKSPSIAEVLSLFLPDGILEYFDIVSEITQDTCFILYLEEKNIVPDEISSLNLHSHGFHPEIE